MYLFLCGVLIQRHAYSDHEGRVFEPCLVSVDATAKNMDDKI